MKEIMEIGQAVGADADAPGRTAAFQLFAPQSAVGAGSGAGVKVGLVTSASEAGERSAVCR